MNLGTNQTLVLQVPASVPGTNTFTTVSAGPPVGQSLQAPASKVQGTPARTNRRTSGGNGAADLMAVATKRAPTKRKTSVRPLPTAPEGAPLTPEQIEAKVVAAIQVSADDQRDLIKQRAQAVQSYILKAGKVAPDRLFIITPKSVAGSAKGETRANLSLD